MRVVGAFDVAVEHHPCFSRRDPDALAGTAARIGRSNAYVCYHWRHHRPSRFRSLLGATVAGFRLHLQLGARSFANALLGVWGRTRSDAPDGTADAGEGLPAWRYTLERRRAFHRQMLREAGRPRNYARGGLRKIAGERDPVGSGTDRRWTTSRLQHAGVPELQNQLRDPA
jgi:hypothetical protein